MYLLPIIPSNIWNLVLKKKSLATMVSAFTGCSYIGMLLLSSFLLGYVRVDLILSLPSK